MSRYPVLPLLGVLMLALVALAREDNPKNGSPTSAVEVRFSDGSLVRMFVVQENIEVQTKYGKLTVPTNEIRRIDFAFRLPEDTAKKVEIAIRDLGHEQHVRREAASKELVGLGISAVPSLQAATRSSDPEVARRATAALQDIRDKFPIDQLRFPVNDTIQTSEFLISGRIITPSLKTKTNYFGDVEVQVADLRQVRWVNHSGENGFAIDAARYANPNIWMDTEITVDAQSPMLITASGQVDLWPAGAGQYMSGANGMQGNRPATNVGGTLLGRIGTNGKVFVIGERYEGQPTEEGRLYLHIVPSPWGNASSGVYNVKVATRP